MLPPRSNNSDESAPTRLNKYLSECGYCSRRAADKLIEEGRIKINGQPALLGTKVLPGDVVEADGRPINTRPEPIYLAFNKPVGVVCTTDRRDPHNIIDFIKHPARIFPIGRLDKSSEGLIFLTNDGDVVNKILRAANRHEKEYIVAVKKPVTDEFIHAMRSGVPVLDRVTLPCFAERMSRHVFRIVLTQGLNRQIRRMCEFLGHDVVSLQRVRIMQFKLDLPVGKWRPFFRKELASLHGILAQSEKVATSEKSAGPEDGVAEE